MARGTGNPPLGRVGAAAALGLCLALGLGPGSGGPPAATATEARPSQVTITVDPSTGLAPSAPVTVTGQGLDLVAYYVQQCGILGEPANQLACNEGTRLELEPGTDGTFSTSLTVQKEFEGVHHDGTRSPVSCADVECVVAVATPAGGEGATHPLSFS